MNQTNFSMGGQVTASGAGGQGGDLIKDTDTRGFMTDVIEASRQVPVIVDFWGPSCGPCKQLTPVLEKVVREAGGKVRLVKVNVEENQALAGQMRIQSIPAVYAFANGQPVDAFMGAVPESEVKAFVAKLTGPSAAELQVEEIIEAAKAAFADKEYAVAAQAYGQVLQMDPGNIAAIAGLAKCQIEAGDTDGARAALELVPAEKQNDLDIVSAHAALELADAAADTGEISELTDKLNADDKDHQARFDLALALNAAGEREQALDHLLTLFSMQRDWNDDAARKQLLVFFEAWGMTDELTGSGRRRLSSLMFS